MSGTVYVVMDAADRPIGGANILIRIAELLAGEGREVCILHNEPRFRYRFWPHDLPVGYDPALRSMLRAARAERSWPVLKRRLLPFLAPGPANPVRRPGAGDIVVMPEYRYGELTRLYPEARRVLAIQDVYGFFRAYLRDQKAGGTALGRTDAVFATSEACRAAAAAVHDGPVGAITLPIDLPGLDFAEEKPARIAYMPRKRPTEAGAVAAALARAPETSGYEIVSIHRKAPDEVAAILRDTRFFLSFSKEEGFGLPPAEAMAAGCIAIGFTGVGGAEFFTPETGIPVPDSDIVGLIAATRAAAAEYAADPARLDALRRQAAATIRARYTAEAFAATTRAVWAEI